MRATLVASVSGTRPLKIGEPRWVNTPGGVDRILRRERHAVQRTELLTCQDRRLRRLRGLDCVVGDRDDRVDLRVDGLDAVEVRLHDLDRRDLAGPDQFGQPGRVGVEDVGTH